MHGGRKLSLVMAGGKTITLDVEASGVVLFQGQQVKVCTTTGKTTTLDVDASDTLSFGAASVHPGAAHGGELWQVLGDPAAQQRAKPAGVTGCDQGGVLWQAILDKLAAQVADPLHLLQKSHAEAGAEPSSAADHQSAWRDQAAWAALREEFAVPAASCKQQGAWADHDHAWWSHSPGLHDCHAWRRKGWHADPRHDRPVPQAAAPGEGGGREQAIAVHVKLRKKTITIVTFASHSVAEFRAQLQATNNAASLKALRYAGKQLHDERSLESYEIVDGSILHLGKRVCAQAEDSASSGSRSESDDHNWDLKSWDLSQVKDKDKAVAIAIKSFLDNRQNDSDSLATELSMQTLVQIGGRRVSGQ